MDTRNQPSQPQSGEEMVKRILAVAELLAKGITTKPNNLDTEMPRKKQTKTQDTKAGVSS
ncbi:MAG TPA: hypothetical protein PLQ56_19885 [Aggregatilineales bacterium]|nr:hypothetical protein [Aggregatilineales bacterium]